MNKIEVAPLKPSIPFEVFERVDLRVGTIVSVEDVPRSRKLVKLTVDFGDRQRTIFAGLKPERANPQEIVGKQSLFVVNLEPKPIMGQVSEGMLLDLGYADRISPVLTVPESPVPNGTRAG